MYDELVKVLRETDFSYGCPCGAEPLCKDKDCVIIQAADAIEELMRRCEQFQYMPPPAWIPVTERLPLYGQDVLAVRTYGDGEKCQEVLMAHIAVWDEETGKKWWNATNITHWMPLPEPPKEEREDADS